MLGKVQYKFTMPVIIKHWLAIRAAKNMRSLSSELIHILQNEKATEEQTLGRASSVATNNNTALQGGASITQDKGTI